MKNMTSPWRVVGAPDQRLERLLLTEDEDEPRNLQKPLPLTRKTPRLAGGRVIVSRGELD